MQGRNLHIADSLRANSRQGSVFDWCVQAYDARRAAKDAAREEEEQQQEEELARLHVRDSCMTRLFTLIFALAVTSGFFTL